jgi:small subunit ribosomal protein S15
MLTINQKKRVIKEAAVSDKDTGSVPVQVSLLTKQIDELTDHLKKHKKDNHSRRGLLMMVGKRRRLLAYLEKNDAKAHKSLLKKLDLKK